MLEKGFYLVVCLAFNHWHTGLELAESSAWPRHVLAAHSSKPLTVERPSLHPHILADAIIGLTLARGQRHEGRQGMTAYYLTKVWKMFMKKHPYSLIQSVNYLKVGRYQKDALATLATIPAQLHPYIDHACSSISGVFIFTLSYYRVGPV